MGGGCAVDSLCCELKGGPHGWGRYEHGRYGGWKRRQARWTKGAFIKRWRTSLYE